MKLACMTYTDTGRELAKQVCADLSSWEVEIQSCFGTEKVDIHAWTEENFSCADALLFVGACGIAVRMIAPYVQSKTNDPAVIVMDEKGTWVIPILSGHIGGANRLALELAQISGGQAVLTTATDVQGVWAVDDWATRRALIIRNPRAIKEVSSRLLRGEEIMLYSDAPILGSVPKQLVLTEDRFTADVVLSPFEAERDKQTALYLIPRCITLGIGCRKGISAETIENAYEKARAQMSIAEESICGVFSIDLKENEEGLRVFCSQHDWDLCTYDAQTLEAVEGSVSHSDFVKQVTGTESVCERSALVEADVLLLEKQAYEGVTIAFAKKNMNYDFEDVK